MSHTEPQSWPNPRFWQGQALALVGSALLMLWAFRYWPLDAWIIAPYASPQGFTLRDAWITTRWAHALVEDWVLLISMGLLVMFGLSYWREKWRQWRQPCGFLLVAMLLSSGTVGLLKSVSPHTCPWDIQAYGGTDLYMPLFSSWPQAKLGKCFPAGHATTGFGLMAIYLLTRRAGFRYAYGYWLAALILGFGFGWVQMMRGAHFLSHTLWSAWWVWLVELLVFALWLRLFKITAQDASIPEKMFTLGR